MAIAPRNGRYAAGMPRWVKASVWIGGALFLVVVVLLALGHGPGQHMSVH
jgi:hypothetical protein